MLIKPLPGTEIDEVLLFKINKHYEHDGIFKAIKKELPKTWDEYLEICTQCRPGIIPAKYAESAKALFKLIELRDHYNDGWEPDYNDLAESKYTITTYSTGIELSSSLLFSYLLAFKTKKLRDEFKTNFAELIETAKPLL